MILLTYSYKDQNMGMTRLFHRRAAVGVICDGGGYCTGCYYMVGVWLSLRLLILRVVVLGVRVIVLHCEHDGQLLVNNQGGCSREITYRKFCLTC